MKLGILGAGKVGRTLGEQFERAGYELLYGTRTEREETLTLQEVASTSDRTGWRVRSICSDSFLIRKL